MRYDHTLEEGGLPFDFMNLYNWLPEPLEREVITDDAHLEVS